MDDRPWLSLMIGNSRLHWAVLARDKVLDAWDSSHLGKVVDKGGEGSEKGRCAAKEGAVEEGIPLSFLSPTGRDILQHGSGTIDNTALDEGSRGAASSEGTRDAMSACLRLDPQRFRVASVVPEELAHWQRRCPGIRAITSQETLSGVEVYRTLGVDRALAVRGAARVRGWPVLVVDCGSALTFTASDQQGRLTGGAILPGVRLQLAALGTRTAQLPSDVRLPEELPPRWAMSTLGGIQAGVMWTIVAGIQSFIKDRLKLEPYTTVVFTGGDGQVLHKAVLESWDAQEETAVSWRAHRDRMLYVGDVIHRGVASVVLGNL